MFEFDALVDEMRTHSSAWLDARRRAVLDEQRALRSEELAITLVLDERGRVDVSRGSEGESARVVRDKVETARRLESLPEIARAAHEGRLSDEQLHAAVHLADEDSDGEWAERAPSMDAAELHRMARNATKPSTETSRAQHDARSLRMWWTDDDAMLHLRGQLPVLMGKQFEDAILALTEQMTPAKGSAWETLEHRAADALLQLCEAHRSDEEPTLAPRACLQVLPLAGPAEIAGVPIPDSLLEQLRANAIIEPVVVDEQRVAVAVGRAVSALSPKIRRAVLLRDARCRLPGCSVRHGLEVHHLRPRTWGGTDEIGNLVAVCPVHHRKLVPYGAWALVGNPNQPDGLHLVAAADLPPP
jgi:hypothetical protein